MVRKPGGPLRSDEHSARRDIIDLRRAARKEGAYLIGVVGFSGSWRLNSRRDAKAATASVLGALFEQSMSESRPWCVSGATDSGVPALAYEAARQRKLPCVGITPREALEHRIAPLDRLVVVGDRFGDESRVFVDACDAFWMFGGGPQSEKEMRMASALGKPIVVVRGIGGRADVLTARDLPSAHFVNARGAP